MTCRNIGGPRTLLAAVLGLTALGCQGDIAPVSGRVTFNGKPLPDATVTFQPRGDRKSAQPVAAGSVGHTDAEGRFALRVVGPERNGAAVGDHTVTISMPLEKSTGGKTQRESRLPKEWRDGTKRFRVPARGTSKANFDITAP